MVLAARTVPALRLKFKFSGITAVKRLHTLAEIEMIQPATPTNESRKRSALQSLRLVDTLSEDRFDRITRIAARLFDVPIALVSLIDNQRQWFKAQHGREASETVRDISFCEHAILEEGALVVGDCRMDPRFADNPLVTGDPAIRFYAGHPIHAPDGSRIGTLCISDWRPRELSSGDLAALADLAGMVDREIALMDLATVDALTPLINRRGFFEIARRMLALCRRQRTIAATLIAMDLNGFKGINDTLGHAAGDDVLRRFGHMLKKHFRHSEVVARMGSDEFCVLASGANEMQMSNSMERFAHDFSKSELSIEHPGLSWNCGLVEFDPDAGNDLEQLLHQADQRMSDAKVRLKRRSMKPDAFSRYAMESAPTRH